MNRILVTGNAGSGKSTVSHQIGELLGTDVIGLDSIVWEPNWRLTPKTKRERFVQEIAAKPHWVVDGVSLQIQERADIVVFLDFPRWLSFWRCARRNVHYLFRSRPGLPENCPEFKVIPTLIKIIWRFPQRVKPKILALNQELTSNQRLVHIKSNSQLRAFLHTLRKTT